MPNLFIIGNGFDLAHHMDTSYNSFKEYVRKKGSEYIFSLVNQAALLFDDLTKVKEQSNSEIELAIKNVEAIFRKMELLDIKTDLTLFLDKYDDLTENYNEQNMIEAIQLLKNAMITCSHMDSYFEALFDDFKDIQAFEFKLSAEEDYLFGVEEDDLFDAEEDYSVVEKIITLREKFDNVMSNMVNYQEEYNEFSGIIQPFFNLMVKKGFNPEEVVDIVSGNQATNYTDKNISWAEFESALSVLNYFSLAVHEETHPNRKKFIKDTKEELETLFKAWIVENNNFSEDNKNSKGIQKISGFADLVSAGDLFLSFNYTETLESLYNIKNVLHIHGSANGDVVVGHDGKFHSAMPDSLSSTEEYTELNSFNKELADSLIKQTAEIMNKENVRDFFKMIETGNIQTVYSYGFSFSSVDLPYVKEICKHLSSDVDWLFNDYGMNDTIAKYNKVGQVVHEKRYDILSNAVKECGFKGKFSTFSVKG
jgi:hypothetical protein